MFQKPYFCKHNLLPIQFFFGASRMFAEEHVFLALNTVRPKLGVWACVKEGEQAPNSLLFECKCGEYFAMEILGGFRSMTEKEKVFYVQQFNKRFSGEKPRLGWWL